MLRFLGKRLGLGLVMLLISSILLFVAMRVIPGDPATTLQGTSVSGLSADEVQAFRRELGLDGSIPVQYVRWLRGALHGDLGFSYYSKLNVTTLIGERLVPTIELTLVALVLALAVAIPAGIAAAMRPRSLIDRIVGAGASWGIASPPFWVGVMLAAIFGVELGWLPTRGYVSLSSDSLGNIQYVILPAITLAVLMGAPITRYLRISLLETLGADFIRTAEGKGVRWHRIVLRHALPNSMIPTLHVIGIVVGHALSGVVYVEYVFGWPGVGALTVDSVQKRDYALLQGLVLLAVIAFIVTTVIVDLLTFSLDPRLRRA